MGIIVAEQIIDALHFVQRRRNGGIGARSVGIGDLDLAEGSHRPAALAGPVLYAATRRPAMAIEGAAENRPAKTFGFTSSAMTANATTMAPPKRPRSTTSQSWPISSIVGGRPASP